MYEMGATMVYMVHHRNKKKQIEPSRNRLLLTKKEKKCRGNAPEKSCYNKKCL